MANLKALYNAQYFHSYINVMHYLKYQMLSDNYIYIDDNNIYCSECKISLSYNHLLIHFQNYHMNTWKNELLKVKQIVKSELKYTYGDRL